MLILSAANHTDTQILIDVAEIFADQGRYTLRPSKTEAIHFNPSSRRTSAEDTHEIYNSSITNVNQSTYRVVIRATTLKDTCDVNVGRNISKARKTIYSLMASGLHDENGLDPETSLHLIQTYAILIV